MTRPNERAGSRGQYGALVVVTAAAALMLGAATFYTVQKLSKDDCTAVTNAMPDGSQVTTTTCS